MDYDPSRERLRVYNPLMDERPFWLIIMNCECFPSSDLSLTPVVGE